MESTKKALGVDEKHSHSWSTCNFGINMKFHDDWMHDFSPKVALLLNADIPVLIYAGDVDFICNYLGNKAWSYNLEWKGKDDFQKAKEHQDHSVLLIIALITQIQRVDSKERNTSFHRLRLVWVILYTKSNTSTNSNTNTITNSNTDTNTNNVSNCIRINYYGEDDLWIYGNVYTFTFSFSHNDVLNPNLL